MQREIVKGFFIHYVLRSRTPCILPHYLNLWSEWTNYDTTDLPNLHALRPIAHVFAQQQIIKGSSTHEVVQLSEDLLHQLRVYCMLS